MQKEKPNITFSVALVLAFLAAEKIHRQLEDLALADFGRLPLGSHGPGILLEKLLGPWKLLENYFRLENPLNLMRQCLNFMKKSLNT